MTKEEMKRELGGLIWKTATSLVHGGKVSPVQFMCLALEKVDSQVEQSSSVKGRYSKVDAIGVEQEVEQTQHKDPFLGMPGLYIVLYNDNLAETVANSQQ